MSLGEAFTGLGYLTGAAVFYWQMRSRRLATEGMGKVALIGVLAGVVGAKLTEAVAESLPIRVPWWTLFNPELSGRSIVGGLVGGWVAVELAKRHYGIRRSTGDLFAMALPAGEAVGRIGCFFNGCCYGSESAVPWAVWEHGAWRHPAQLYSSAVAAAIFGVVAFTRCRASLAEGFLFRLYLVLFGLGRFCLEFVRVNPVVFGGLTAVQWFCLELVAMAAVMSWIAGRRARRVVVS